MRLAGMLILAVAALLIVSAFTGTRPSAAVSGPIVVEITDSGFSPSALTIVPHTTVTWVNRGSASHSVTAESGSVPNSPTLSPRFSYSYTFHNEGSFPYHDSVNTALRGVVTVAVGTEPTAEPTPTPAPASTPTPAPSPSPTPAAPAPTPADSTAAVSSPATVAPTRQLATAGSTAEPAGTGGARAPASASSAPSTVAVDAGTEWFGGPGYQAGVYYNTVPVGTTVQWNIAEGVHNVTECGTNWSGAGSSCAGAAWSSSAALLVGDSFSHTFDTAGTFYYLCTIHPQNMRGAVVVEAGGGDTQQPDPSDSQPTPQPTATPNSSSPTAQAAKPAAVAGESSLPNGGGAPPSSDPLPPTPFFIAAAAAFLASAVIFWRLKGASK